MSPVRIIHVCGWVSRVLVLWNPHCKCCAHLEVNVAHWKGTFCKLWTSYLVFRSKSVELFLLFECFLCLLPVSVPPACLRALGLLGNRGCLVGAVTRSAPLWEQQTHSHWAISSPHTFFVIWLFFFCLFVFETTSRSPGGLRTHSVTEGDLELILLLASQFFLGCFGNKPRASCMLGTHQLSPSRPRNKVLQFICTAIMSKEWIMLYCVHEQQMNIVYLLMDIWTNFSLWLLRMFSLHTDVQVSVWIFSIYWEVIVRLHGISAFSF